MQHVAARALFATVAWALRLALRLACTCMSKETSARGVVVVYPTRRLQDGRLCSDTSQLSADGRRAVHT